MIYIFYLKIVNIHLGAIVAFINNNINLPKSKFFGYKLIK